MQMNDKFFAHGMNKEQADNEMLLLFLKQLSVKSKAIKEIHQKYHSLSNDFRLVAVFLTNPVIYEKIVTNRSRALRNARKNPCKRRRHVSLKHNFLPSCVPALKICW